MNLNTITQVQRDMLTILQDGRIHSVEELHTCLHDELQPIAHVQMHISSLRKLLRPNGLDVVCRVGNPSSYVLMRRMAGARE